MTAESTRLNWIRIVVAAIVAELLPILLLILVVVVYGIVRQEDSISPEEFAPRAGNWVGPIGGFLMTFLCAHWVARRATGRAVAHGVAIGVGTALLDVGIGFLLAGGEAVAPVFFVSNGGRICAGYLGGWLAARGKNAASSG